MPRLLDLLDQYIFGGIPSNAVYDLIKISYEKANCRSWEDLFLDAFQTAVDEARPSLERRYAIDGEVGLNREALSKLLRYNLRINVETSLLSALRSHEFAAELAKAMAAENILVIGGHNLSQPDYAQFVRNIVRNAKSLFKEAILANEPAFRRVLLDEELATQDLVQEVQGYLSNRFGIVLDKLDRIEGKVDAQTGLLEQIVGAVQYIPPRPVDPNTLAEARQRLARLPLDTIPEIASLPTGSRMPLSHNPLFVGREDDLRALAKMLKVGDTAAIGQIAVVTGLGGIGKTQLACEFVHRYGQYFVGGVFWLSFADASAVPDEIAACGSAGGINLRPDFSSLPLQDQVDLVLAAWQSEMPRLLVFDNCEEEELLQQWRPKSGSCCVLVTSRRAQWDAMLDVQMLPLGVLSREESIHLLGKHRPDLPADDADLDAIAAELGDLPLALHLAGSFLAKYRRVVTPAPSVTTGSMPLIQLML